MYTIDEIPIIDLASITTHLDHVENSNENKNIASVISEIGDACEKWGFFKVINHGIPLENFEKLKLKATEFFSLSKDEKMKVNRDEYNPMGYSYLEYNNGGVKDVKETFDFTVRDLASPLCLTDDVEPHQMELISRWPDFPSHFSETAKEYVKQVEKLCHKLLEIIALSLGLSANTLTNYCKDASDLARITYYCKPSIPSDNNVIGLGAHTDEECITILADDGVNGLQIKRKSDGEWINVTHVRGALFVNLGDVLQVWSNDKYHSVEHRVIANPEKDRMSVGVFLGPSNYVNVSPLEELIDEKKPAKYKEYNWGAFRAARFMSYVKIEDEIQISDFKINQD